MDTRRQWLGDAPDVCDVCRGNIKKEFSDAVLPGRGVWGLFCRNCSTTLKVAYGKGRGQRYTHAGDGTWRKVA